MASAPELRLPALPQIPDDVRQRARDYINNIAFDEEDRLNLDALGLITGKDERAL